MNNKIHFIRIQTAANQEVDVDFIPVIGKVRTHESVSDSSLYRLLNNSMVGEVVPFKEHDRFLMEVYPRG